MIDFKSSSPLQGSHSLKHFQLVYLLFWKGFGIFKLQITKKIIVFLAFSISNLYSIMRAGLNSTYRRLFKTWNYKKKM